MNASQKKQTKEQEVKLQNLITKRDAIIASGKDFDQLNDLHDEITDTEMSIRDIARGNRWKGVDPNTVALVCANID